MSHSLLRYSHLSFQRDSEATDSSHYDSSSPWQITDLAETFIGEVPIIIKTLNATTDLLNKQFIELDREPPFKKIAEGVTDQIAAAFILTKAFYTNAKRQFKTTSRFTQPPYFNPDSDDIALLIDDVPYFHSTFPLNGAENSSQAADEHLFILFQTIAYTSEDSKLKRAIVDSLFGGRSNAMLMQAIIASKLGGAFDEAENNIAYTGYNFYESLFKTKEEYCAFKEALAQVAWYSEDLMNRDQLMSLMRSLERAGEILSTHNSCLTTFISSRLNVQESSRRITMDAAVNSVLRVYSDVMMKLMIEYGENF
jgi:hypothetical protein